MFLLLKKSVENKLGGIAPIGMVVHLFHVRTKNISLRINIIFNKFQKFRDI